MKFLVTGAAGFIGNFVAERLCEEGHDVVGLDNLNDYYDPQLKLDRLKRIEHFDNFRFIKMDVSDREGIATLFEEEKFQRVIHLAAQAGVRYSIENPMAYIDSNLVGFATILEGCRHNNVEHLMYASSSSVYGANKKIPFSEDDSVDHPVSLYAATKKSNELMAHTYSHLYKLPTIGLRFFTVYGPWGRPDMAPLLFTDAIANGRPIKVFNYGKMQRDFTYIDDIINNIIELINIFNSDGKITSSQVVNIGNGAPVKLEEFISCLESHLGKSAIKEYVAMQPGDVTSTYSSNKKIISLTNYRFKNNIKEGTKHFCDWYKGYYND